MRAAWETIGGLWMLLRLAIRTRFRFGSPYWRWRIETAFGGRSHQSLTRRQKWAVIIAYARWAWRMRPRG